MPGAGDQVRGTVEPGFGPVADVLAEIAAAGAPFAGAQLCVYVDGRPVIDVVAGDGLAPEDLTGVYSVSKGLGALVVSALAGQGRIDLEAPIATLWPELGEHGAGSLAIADVLAHRAGLIGTADMRLQHLLDSEAGGHLLASHRPAWVPGRAFGYHALTMGILMEEVVRRATGMRLQQHWDELIRRPRAIDAFLGLPDEHEQRFVPLLPPLNEPVDPVSMPRMHGVEDIGIAFTGLTFGYDANEFNPNNPAVRRVGPSGFGGVASARGLARAYASAIGEVDGRTAFLTPDVVELMAHERSWGRDRMIAADRCHSVVFMRPHRQMPFGSHRAFGHDGAGGAMAFADPAYGMAFGFVPRRMEALEKPHFLRLAEVLAHCL